MRILLLSSEVVPERAGGIASYTSVIAPALAARDHEVHVLSCAPEHERRDDRIHGVWWHRRPLLTTPRPGPDAGRFPHAALRLVTAATVRAEIARLRIRPDVVESPEWLAESLFVSPTLRAPVVVHLHTPARVLFGFDRPRLNADLRTADRMERAAARRASATTAASALLARTLTAHGWLQREPAVVPLPVDATSWECLPPSAGPPVVLLAGRIEPRKAPELAVRALAELAGDVPDVTLELVGRSRGHRESRPFAEWLSEQAQRAGVRVTFHEQVPLAQMRERYARARVVAVPSRFESFSMTALEAMAASRPVVVGSRVGAGELIGGTGAGAVFADGDASALAEALRPYLADPSVAAAAGSAGRSLVERECAPDTIAARRETVYTGVARSPRGRA